MGWGGLGCGEGWGAGAGAAGAVADGMKQCFAVGAGEDPDGETLRRWLAGITGFGGDTASVNGAALLATAQRADAAPFVLTFEGLQNGELVEDFYNGGTGSSGSSGFDYGVELLDVSEALIDLDPGGSGNFANEPTPDTVVFFTIGGEIILDVAAGFDVGFVGPGDGPAEGGEEEKEDEEGVVVVDASLFTLWLESTSRYGQ